MSSTEDYTAKIAEITAIPNDVIKSPNMPIDIFLQEVENTFKWIQEDKEKLISSGLDWTIVEDMPVRAGALREAQSIWYKTRFSKKAAQKEWNEKSPNAYDLRDTLLHDFRFAFRNETDLKSRIDVIAEGSGNADMIQDLNDLSLLGKEYPDALSSIGFDLTQLDIAAALASEMAEILSEATTDRSEEKAERNIRDKAYTFVKQVLDEVRICGQYVFWRDSARVKGYSSQYFKNRRKKNTKKIGEETKD